MTNEINSRKIRIGRKTIEQHRFIIWVDSEDADLTAAGEFFMEKHLDKNAHPRVAEVAAECGHVYAVRLAEKGMPR